MTMLSHYRQHQFDPVPVDPDERWFTVRRNLYEHHLGIPVGLLEGKQVLEFGPATGSVSAFLVHLGAKLTLVEPNSDYVPRLKEQFGNDVYVYNATMEAFSTNPRYDVVLAEGFLFTLEDRDAMVGKIASLLKPGGIGVLSFQDRYGGLIEMVKRLLLANVNMAPPAVESQSDESLTRAKTLFLEDFQKLNASRPFEAWWRDVLVNPSLADRYQWSYQNVIPLIEAAGCEVLGTSPRWTTVDHLRWHKDFEAPTVRHHDILSEWIRHLPFFLTGHQYQAAVSGTAVPAAIEILIRRMSEQIEGNITSGFRSDFDPIRDYLVACQNHMTTSLAKELAYLFGCIDVGATTTLFDTYRLLGALRQLWGTPYHYISFVKQ